MSARTLAERRPHLVAFAYVFAATLFCFLAVGAVLPILPRYVVGPLDGGDIEVGIVAGVFAFTSIIGRPIGGRIADERGRRIVVLVGLAFVSVSGLLIVLPLGIAGLVLSRLVLGWGNGWVFTAGLAWAVDLAPEDRRGQIIGFYGLGVWGGLALGPPIGEGIYALAGYDAVWAFAAASPVVGAVAARFATDSRQVTVAEPDEDRRGRVLPRPAVRPGVALFMASFGYATLAGFLILHLEEQGTGGGAAVLTAFAATVVLTRLGLVGLPDRIGARTTAIASAVAQAIGLALIAVAGGLPVSVAGALVMGTGFSLSFPSLALLVVERVDEQRRGAAMGGFGAFFDLGMGVGAPVAGAIASIGGYGLAFGVAAAAAAVGAVVAGTATGERTIDVR